MIAVNVAIYCVLSFLLTFLLYPLFPYYQSKLLSFVVVCFVSFLIAHFVSYPLAFYTVLAVFLAVAVINVFKHKPEVDKGVELAFFVVFFYFLFLRWLNPDIFGAEKFMDSAFISAILNSPNLPPNDPFLAGYRLTCYYYFGHVIGASVTLMSFTKVQYGYNIAMASIAAYAASTLYGFLRDLGMKRPWFGVILTMFTGDVYGFYELLKDLFTIHRISWLYYWNATRVIPGTINEFPYFSFLHADFHAHVVAIPLFILAISLLYYFERNPTLKHAVVLAIMSAVLYLTNSWDSPVFLACFALLVLSAPEKEKVLTLIFCVVSAFLASTTIHSAAARVIFVNQRSPLLAFLLYFAGPFAYAYAWAFDSAKHRFSTSVMTLMALIALIALKVPIAIVVLPLALISLLHFKPNRFLSVLVVVACFFTFLPEFVAIDCRMNTVFKFYEVCWILLCIPGAIAFEKIKKSKKALLLLILAASLVYPAIATPQKCSPMRFTLNGLEFTKYFGEYDAILWAQSHVKGVIMSAAYNCYTYGGRFAAFTGNPVVVGWACHEVQWRGNGKMLAERMLDVKLFYSDPVHYWKVLKKYNVSYVILGYEERKEFNASKVKFTPLVGRVLRLAYSSGDVTIYRVI